MKSNSRGFTPHYVEDSLWKKRTVLMQKDLKAKSRLKGHSAGFTLVEVILALVIVGASVSILSHGIVNSGRTELESKEYTTAALIASSKMAEVESGAQSINQVSEGLVDNHPNFRWKITPSATESDKVTKVELSIIFTLSGKEYTYLITRFINSSLVR